MTRSHRRAWTLAVVLVCGIVVVASLTLSAVTFIRQSRSEAVRAAERKAQAATQVSQCFQQAKNIPQVLRILGVIDLLASNSIIATTQALKASDPDDPLIPSRKASLGRLLPARHDLRVYIKNTAAAGSTKQQCNKLAAALGVDPTHLKDGKGER